MDHRKKQKILIVALAQSSHTQSWIDLIDRKKFEVRLFGVDSFRSEKMLDFLNYDLVSNFPFVNQKPSRNRLFRIIRKLFNLIDQKFGNFLGKWWLNRIIKSWQPEIIHTLGLEPASYYYLNVIKRYGQNSSRWVVTARGGPELALNYLLLNYRERIEEVLKNCDSFLADNQQNYEIAQSLGLDLEKVASIGFVPGTGGVEIDELINSRKIPASESRLIIWPKAYDCLASKGLPVLEAIKLAWPKIRPCQIVMTVVTPEIRLWFETLPQEIKRSCHLYERIGRKELLKLFVKARIVLSPSLTDGIPNVLYESMAAGALPIFSPIKTISSLFTKKNVLFARNLYPNEIAQALIQGMQNDQLVDKMVASNLLLVRRIADRKKIARKVNFFYTNLLINKGV